ncbi:MAG: hypothetical protein M5U34_31160 [Chloroflexi bacterium]|nr:hypothetical protein [Chloroflexota bacterium]
MKKLRNQQIRPYSIIIISLLLLWLTGCAGAKTYTETFDEPGTWRVGSDADAIGQVTDGVYDMRVKADDVTIWTTAGESFSDGVYEVEATQVSGPLNNGFGLVFRLDNNKDDFYLFKISSDGYVWIGRYRNGGAKAEPLVGEWWFESPAVQQGLNKRNTLRVRAEGANLIFAVNGQEVGRVTDSAFASGDIGLLVETLGLGDVQVQFDNLR